MKKHLKYIFALIIIAIICVCAFKITLWIKENNDVKKVVKEIEKKVVVEEIEIPTPLEEETTDYTKIPLYSVDIKSLKADNKDTVGWIKVNGTKINYPVVQTKDNNYYLNHTFNKEYNSAGWIFLDYRNDLQDKNMIIYGHRRRDATLFGSLGNFLNPKTFINQENNYLNFITDSYSAVYQVFSVYTSATNNHIITEFPNDYLYKLFLEEITIASLIPFDITTSETDKIITLSTCKNETEKIVVHAKLIKTVEL